MTCLIAKSVYKTELSFSQQSSALCHLTTLLAHTQLCLTEQMSLAAAKSACSHTLAGQDGYRDSFVAHQHVALEAKRAIDLHPFYNHILPSVSNEHGPVFSPAMLAGQDLTL